MDWNSVVIKCHLIKTGVCVCVCRSESLSAESHSVQSSPSFRLLKSRSESDLSQPESDEECYALVRNTLDCINNCCNIPETA